MHSQLIPSVLLIAGAYLLGSIPTSYLAGRWARRIDLRDYGSGTVSGSGVWEHVSRWLIAPVGLVDVGKGALPVWLGVQFGLNLPVATAAGLTAVVGHNWPVFLRFHGGRGLGTFMGVLFVIYPWGVPWLLAFLAIGWIAGDSAPLALVGMVTLPVLAHNLGGPDIVLSACTAMLLLTLVKRLEASRRPFPPKGPERRRVIFLRLVFDRDIRDHSAWIARKPDGSAGGDGGS